MPIGASIWGPLAVSVVGGLIAKTSTQSNMPQVSPAYAGLQGQILQQIQARLSQPVDLHGYEANGISTINKAYGAVKQTNDNNLSARGLSTSPVAANVDATRTTGEAGDVATFQNSVPLLAQQIESQNLAQANSILAGGTGSTGTMSSGGGLAGAATNLAGMMGYLKGKGAFGNGQQQANAGGFYGASQGASQSLGSATDSTGGGNYGGVGSGSDGY